MQNFDAIWRRSINEVKSADDFMATIIGGTVFFHPVWDERHQGLYMTRIGESAWLAINESFYEAVEFKCNSDVLDCLEDFNLWPAMA